MSRRTEDGGSRTWYKAVCHNCGWDTDEDAPGNGRLYTATTASMARGGHASKNEGCDFADTELVPLDGGVEQ